MVGFRSPEAAVGDTTCTYLRLDTFLGFFVLLQGNRGQSVFLEATLFWLVFVRGA